MIISVRTYKTTTFLLVYSQVNSCFVFNRTDVATNTETTLLTDCDNEQQARDYFNNKVEFFCLASGITSADMTEG